jgi:hypothetical protein
MNPLLRRPQFHLQNHHIPNLLPFQSPIHPTPICPINIYSLRLIQNYLLIRFLQCPLHICCRIIKITNFSCCLPPTRVPKFPPKSLSSTYQSRFTISQAPPIPSLIAPHTKTTQTLSQTVCCCLSPNLQHSRPVENTSSPVVMNSELNPGTKMRYNFATQNITPYPVY